MPTLIKLLGGEFMATDISMSNPKVVDFLDEFKVTFGYSVTDEDLSDNDYIVLLRKSVREIGAYGTEIRRDTLKVEGGVANTSELNASIIIACYNTTDSPSSSTNNNDWLLAPSLGTNIESYAGAFFSNTSISQLRVSQFALGALRIDGDKLDYQFDPNRQILLIPSNPKNITVVYMKQISDINFMIDSSYWNTLLYELFRANVMITLGTIYKKVTVDSNPVKYNTDLFEEGTQIKSDFMERMRDSLFTFSPT